MDGQLLFHAGTYPSLTAVSYPDNRGTSHLPETVSDVAWARDITLFGRRTERIQETDMGGY